MVLEAFRAQPANLSPIQALRGASPKDYLAVMDAGLAQLEAGLPL